jgi:hypothetical protein
MDDVRIRMQFSEGTQVAETEIEFDHRQSFNIVCMLK